MAESYTIPQAATVLGVSRATLWRWVRSGKATAEQLTPRLWLISHAEVERLACATRHPPVED